MTQLQTAMAAVDREDGVGGAAAPIVHMPRPAATKAPPSTPTVKRAIADIRAQIALHAAEVETSLQAIEARLGLIEV